MNGKYEGMTVNERLYVSGIIDEFDLAVEKKDIKKVIDLLRGIELNEMSIKAILKEYGLEK